jgi:3-hydroxy-9,10-secoandrosta-1,3,5(10)-triene-9,17-dione monooxygenase reductase component
MDISNQFARRGSDKWAGIAWSPARSGNALLCGALLRLDCEVWTEHDAGDHLIVIGHVRGIAVVDDAKAAPLLFYKGG